MKDKVDDIRNFFKSEVYKLLMREKPEDSLDDGENLADNIIQFLENVVNNSQPDGLLHSLRMKKMQDVSELYTKLTKEELGNVLGNSYKLLNAAKNVPKKINKIESNEELEKVMKFINLMINKNRTGALEIESSDVENSFLNRLKENVGGKENKIDYSNITYNAFIVLFQKSFYNFKNLRLLCIDYIIEYSNKIMLKWNSSTFEYKVAVEDKVISNSIFFDSTTIKLWVLGDKLSITDASLDISKNIVKFVGKIKEVAKNTKVTNNTEVFYRGQADMNYMVSPSLYRDEKFYQRESDLCDEAIRRMPDEFINKNSRLDQLVHMQHHSLPTRVLDVTTDYKVGLFFACYDQYKTSTKKYGEVIMLATKESSYSRSDKGTLLAALSGLSDVEQEGIGVLADIFSNLKEYKSGKAITEHNLQKILPSKSFEKYKEKCNNAGVVINNNLTEELFTAKHRLLHQIRLEKPTFTDDIIYKDLLSIIFIKPDMKNPRIVRQNGAFILAGLPNKKDKVDSIIEKIEERRVKDDKEAQIFLIAPDMKKPMLDWLRDEGITEDYLFPEMPYVMKAVKETIQKKSRK